MPARTELSAAGAALLVALSACSGASAGDAPNDDAPASSTAGVPASELDGDETSGSGDPTLAHLSPTEHLTRASIALRGVRPSLEELEAVERDERYVEAIIDWYLDSEEFGLTLREMHEEALLIGVDPIIYPAGFPARGELAGRSLTDINKSVIEAPLRLIEHVVTEGRPYSEIVTADYTLADATVATVWGLPYDDQGPDWQETRYQDGRPSAGILSDSFLFTRHSTTYSNKSRGRANLISRVLLCYDFLSRDLPVDSGIDLADEEAVAHAVANDPVCASCHQSLDPLAAFLSPFRPIYVPAQLESYPYRVYTNAFRDAFRVTDPGYFGTPGDDVADLGRQIARDPRFASCAARRFFAYLSEVELDQVPTDIAEELTSTFVDSGLDAKALARAVVLSEPFRRSHALEGADEAHADGLVGLLKARPRALARMIEELTGYRWRTNLPFEIGSGLGRVGEVDLMSDSFFGFRVLFGGTDGNSVTRPSHTTSATAVLVLQNLAGRAAEHVVEADFATADRARRLLLTEVDEDTTTPDAIAAQVALLERRFYGEHVAPEDEAVEDAVSLYFDALDHAGDSRRAWQTLLYAMLQDPRLIYY